MRPAKAKQKRVFVTGYSANGYQFFYELSHPYKHANYIVIVHQKSCFFGDTTFVFKASRTGKITYYQPLLELPAFVPADRVLKELGYRKVETDSIKEIGMELISDKAKMN